jgi:glucose-6-phosphate isomerase
MQVVLVNRRCPASDPLYYMYRDLALSSADRCWLDRAHLRYDITVIPPRDLCGEYVKTKGHYHPCSPEGIGYPELYEVMDGQAQFLLQSRTLDDAILVLAGTGARVIIPPGYGHITINPSTDSTLVLSNLVSTAFESEYGEYEIRHGAAYYIMTGGRLVRNRNYPNLPQLRRIVTVKGKDTAGRSYTGPIYSLIGDRQALAFLNEPGKYPAVFTGLLKG